MVSSVSLLRSLNFCFDRLSMVRSMVSEVEPFADLLDLTARSFCGLSWEICHSLAVSPNKSPAKKILMLTSQRHLAIGASEARGGIGGGFLRREGPEPIERVRGKWQDI